MPRFSFLLIVLCLPLVVGCQGCRPQGDASNEPEEKAPVQDFTSRSAESFPGGSGPVDGGIKPGHWFTASQTIKSNKTDSRGQLRSDAIASGTNLSGKPVYSPSEKSITSVRPIVLPVGQRRRIDFRLLAPIPASAEQTRLTVGSRFVATGSSVYFDTGRQPFHVMASEEYFFVILTNRPERFSKFQVADWVRPFRDEESFQRSEANYRIVIPPTDGMLPIAETMLDWTSTAVVLWDDLSPDALTPGQATAMADWVRFGGQLIINGADASDAVAKTKLADTMPLRPTGNIELDSDAGEKLLRNWAVKTDRSTEQQVSLLRSSSGRIAVDGRLSPDAEVVKDSETLLLFRRIGRGRVVQSRFDLTSEWLSSWESFDSFINAAVLLRPRRQFVESVDVMSDKFTSQQYADSQLRRATPAMNSRFRITARDAILRHEVKKAPEEPDTSDAKQSDTKQGLVVATSNFVDPLTRSDAISGISAWNNNSDTLRTAREILIDEAGIEIPKSSLIAKSLGIYLLLLVPVNYIVFRLLGRLEYAWLAVPVIAIGGAFWVARLARLDIGFARSQTEFALLEMHAGYPRGHLSRVIAIYNSLSSNYEIAFNTPDAIATPVDTSTEDSAIRNVVFNTSYSDGPSLGGVAVASGRTQHIHAEQILDVGGSIVRSGDSISNGTNHEFYDAFVIEKDSDGQVRVAILGLIAPAGKVQLKFRSMDAAPITDELPMQSALLLRQLASPEAMSFGTTRLIARIDASLPGMTITPPSSQSAAQTIVLAHLQSEPLFEPMPDVNLAADFRPVNKLQPDSSDETK